MAGRAMRLILSLVVACGLVAGCATIEHELPFGRLTGSSPKAAVGRVFTAIAAGDLATARSIACPQEQAADVLPINLNIRFGMAGAPEIGDAEILSTLEMDLSGLAATETMLDADNATVEVQGPIALHYDLDHVRALLSRVAGADAADTALLVLGDGTITVSLHESFALTRVDGAWRMCGAAADGG